MVRLPQPGCCCSEPPPFYGTRKLWTKRPWGAFYRPYDVALWEATKVDILNNLGETIGQTGIIGPKFHAAVEHYSIEDIFERDALMLYHGTRYTTISVRITRDWDDGANGPIHHESLIIQKIDPNTGVSHIPTWEDHTLTEAEEGYIAQAGDLVGWTEEVTETGYTVTTVTDWLTQVIEVELFDPVTLVDQLERAQAHIDFCVAEMTQDDLKALTMTLPGGQSWTYRRFNPPQTLPPSARLQVLPHNGSASILDGLFVWEDWQPGAGHSFEQDSEPSGAEYWVLNGVAHHQGDAFIGLPRTTYVARSFVYPDAWPLGYLREAGWNDGTWVVVQVLCVQFDTSTGCEQNGRNMRFQSIAMADDQARPVWDGFPTCSSSPIFFPAGWYLLKWNGVAMGYSPSGEGVTLNLPSTPNFAMEMTGTICCPP